jgi:heme-degrading monooxygenase HmoA
MTAIAATPEPPYYAVIFTSQRTDGDLGYHEMAVRMAELAAQQPGYLGIETVRGEDGIGITVSYWSSLESIKNWKAVGEHRGAQTEGRRVWYQEFRVRICKVEREYGFTTPQTAMA